MGSLRFYSGSLACGSHGLSVWVSENRDSFSYCRSVVFIVNVHGILRLSNKILSDRLGKNRVEWWHLRLVDELNLLLSGSWIGLR